MKYARRDANTREVRGPGIRAKSYPNNVPLLEESSYMKGPQYDTENQLTRTRDLFSVINHPDKLIKKFDIPALVRLGEYNISSIPHPLSHIDYEITYLAGELGIGAKIYGYYVHNTDMIIKNQGQHKGQCYTERYIVIVMEKVEGKMLLTIDKNYIPIIYNNILKVSEILINNGIKNDYIKPDNVILQSNGKIRILDFSLAYNVCKPHPSKKTKLIKMMVFALNPNIFNLYPDFVVERYGFVNNMSKTNIPSHYLWEKDEIRSMPNQEILVSDYYINASLIDSDLIPKNAIYEDKSKTLLDYRQIQDSIFDNSLFFHD